MDWSHTLNRTLNVSTVFGDDALRFSSLKGREEVSRLFEFNVILKSEQKDLDPQAILGTPVTVEVELAGGAKRHLNGQCAHFMLAGKEGRHYLYHARLKPWLWYTERRSDYRIFQNMLAQDMIQQVLGNYPFSFKFLLTRQHREWEYCVQYGETDLNFVMRMMENEGMWFWFEHSAGEHTLVISDDLVMCETYPNYAEVPYFDPDFTYPDEDYLDTWAAGSDVTTGQYMAHDYNFTMPRSDLPTQRDNSLEHAHGSYEVFNYPGGYCNTDEGEQYARTRLEELQSIRKRGFASGSARGMAPGYLFNLLRHPAGSQNREYFIVAANYHWVDNDYEATSASREHLFRIDLETHCSDQPFRAERLTAKPSSLGPETATVTGPEGQEIYTDEYGRIKVSFPWNRYCSKDENSSCWIRVSHPWAGAGFGGIHIPRIGQEVLVDYLNGDPDRPVVTSRVYNAFQMPPWELPGNATQSGFLTRSSLDGDSDNANALRFEDKKGAEQLWIHAERNQDIEVENDETHWVGNDRSKTIDRDETTQVKRDRTETVDRDETITIHGDRKEEVDGNETIDIHKNRTETVDGNEKITIHKNRTKTVDKNETDKIGGNWSTTVSKNKTEMIGMLNVKTVGMAYNENIGMAHASIVGLQRLEVTGFNKTETVSGGRSANVSKSDALTVGEELKVQAKRVEINASDEILLICGTSSIKLTPELIEVLSTLVKINT